MGRPSTLSWVLTFVIGLAMLTAYNLAKQEGNGLVRRDVIVRTTDEAEREAMREASLIGLIAIGGALVAAMPVLTSSFRNKPKKDPRRRD